MLYLDPDVQVLQRGAFVALHDHKSVVSNIYPVRCMHYDPTEPYEWNFTTFGSTVLRLYHPICYISTVSDVSCCFGVIVSLESTRLLCALWRKTSISAFTSSCLCA